MKQTIEYEYFDNSSHFLIACVQLKKYFFPILVRSSFLISTYVERKAGSYTTTGLSFCQDQLRSTINLCMWPSLFRAPFAPENNNYVCTNKIRMNNKYVISKMLIKEIKYNELMNILPLFLVVVVCCKGDSEKRDGKYINQLYLISLGFWVL